MENIKQELETLYNQKRQIEEKILLLEQKILEEEKKVFKNRIFKR